MCPSQLGLGRLSGPRRRGAHARRHGAGRDRQQGHCHHSRLTGREPSGWPCASRPGYCRQHPISRPGGAEREPRAHKIPPGGSSTAAQRVDPERSYSPGRSPGARLAEIARQTVCSAAGQVLTCAGTSAGSVAGPSGMSLRAWRRHDRPKGTPGMSASGVGADYRAFAAFSGSRAAARVTAVLRGSHGIPDAVRHRAEPG